MLCEGGLWEPRMASQQGKRDLSSITGKELNSSNSSQSLEDDPELQKGMQSGPHLDGSLAGPWVEDPAELCTWTPDPRKQQDMNPRPWRSITQQWTPSPGDSRPRGLAERPLPFLPCPGSHRPWFPGLSSPYDAF